ncbi:hypothetical protein O181_109218 [Austropuccinia psidii MF-1]|uniref:Uncharacterized protein n=1 Tax=Austropuccinia psidii MF-1 TaxID=1389203 RepID=A0A9Q3JVN5_9BASI|nr:hypothetical protein [Austropuccinia psidii MF-1]
MIRSKLQPLKKLPKSYRQDYGRSQSVTEGQGSVNESQIDKLCSSDGDNTVLPSKRAETSTRSLSGHLQSQSEGLKQCISAQRVPDPCRYVEKLHEFLPDCEKTPGPSHHFKVIQWMSSIDGKENKILLMEEWRKNNPPPPKKLPKTAPIARSSSSNVKKQPQAQNKGKGKASATNLYSQGYIIPKIQQDAMENVFQMARTMIKLQKKEEARLKYQK